MGKIKLTSEIAKKLPLGQRLYLLVWADELPSILEAYVTLESHGGINGCVVRIEKIIQQGPMSKAWNVGDEFNAVYQELELEMK